MPEHEDRLDRERRLRQAAITAATHQAPEPSVPDEPEDEVPAHRIQQQARWVDLQVRQAIDRGDFDNLPGAGKPLRLPDRHDPDWWVKSLIERERLTAALPPAFALRNEEAELEATLDREATPEGVRRTVEDFNRRVVEARRQLQGGPPVVTPTRDVEDEVARWGERRAAQRERRREQSGEPAPAPRRRRWWSRRR